MTVSDGIEANLFEIENVGMKASQRERKALCTLCTSRKYDMCNLYVFN